MRSLAGPVSLAPQLGGKRHRAGAAARATHGDENALLLFVGKIAAIQQLGGLLLEQFVQCEVAGIDLLLARRRRSFVRRRFALLPFCHGSISPTRLGRRHTLENLRACFDSEEKRNEGSHQCE
jgi:hypothetical protein